MWRKCAYDKITSSLFGASRALPYHPLLWRFLVRLGAVSPSRPKPSQGAERSRGQGWPAPSRATALFARRAAFLTAASTAPDSGRSGTLLRAAGRARYPLQIAKNHKILLRFVPVAVWGSVFLSGCANQILTKHLNQMMGQNIGVLVNRWGYPDSERTILGHKIYIWGSTSQSMMYMPQTSYTTAYVGNVPIQSTTTSGAFIPMTASCIIQVAVDSSDDISSWQFRGNQAGCAPYAYRIQ